MGKQEKPEKLVVPPREEAPGGLSISFPIRLDSDARKAAFDSGETYSGFIARAIRDALLQIQAKS